MGKVMKIFLIRHGEDKDNAASILNGRRDESLTEKGLQQAQVVAQKLKEYNIDCIYTSPLLRAHQTAQIISDIIGIEQIITDQLLIERDFGILTGRPVPDIPVYTDKIINFDGVNYFLEVEGAESFSVLYGRAQKFLLEAQSDRANKIILIVSHGDIGKMIRGAHYGWGWERSLKTPYFHNTDIIELS